MKNKTALINCLLFVGILWCVFGCADTDSDSESNPSRPKPPNSTALPATIFLHAAELVREFETNEARAGQLYLGKRVRIHGTVNAISAAANGGFTLTFKTSISTYTPAQCNFSQAYANQLAQINANQEATVEGTVRGFTQSRFTILLDNCSIP